MELSGYCVIEQAVQQGCPMSLILFNIYIRHVTVKGYTRGSKGQTKVKIPKPAGRVLI